jgi:hypothetical protein
MLTNVVKSSIINICLKYKLVNLPSWKNGDYSIVKEKSQLY